MKVSELASKLSKLDQNLEIYCYEEGPTPIPRGWPGPFDLGDVSVAGVKMSRDSANRALLTFDQESSRSVVIIGITPDF